MAKTRKEVWIAAKSMLHQLIDCAIDVQELSQKDQEWVEKKLYTLSNKPILIEKVKKIKDDNILFSEFKK